VKALRFKLAETTNEGIARERLLQEELRKATWLLVRQRSGESHRD
jgi:hypothetical protein